MAEKKIKVRRKDMRKQRWASIIAALLAMAMMVSAIAAYSGHLLNRDKGEAGDPQQQIDPEAAREVCLGEIERLEKYIKEIGATAPVLGELVGYYGLLIQLGEGEEKVAEDVLQGYRDNLIKYSRDLIELEPEKVAHRLQLLEYYKQFGEKETVVSGEVEALRALLHGNPEPASTLMFIGFLKSLEQYEEVLEVEAAWLEQHFEELEASEKLDGENRYYYAYLLGEYLGKTTEAKKQLALIMDQESEESREYLAAKGYLEQLQQAAERNAKGEK